MEFFKKPIFISKLSKRQLISLASFLIILISLPLAIFLTKQQQSYQGRAMGPEARPINVKITNLHGGGFSVSWTSVSPTTENFQETTGSVLWGTDQNNLTQEAFDDRGQDISSATHHISIVNLNPNTTYFFKIKSGPDNYGKSGENWVKAGAAVQQATPVELTLSGSPQPIYGYIKNQAGDKIPGALVSARLKKAGSDVKSALMSVVTNPKEGWVMDAKNARSEDLTSFFIFDDNDRVLIEVQAAENGTATADFVVSECSPAPEIILIPAVVSTPTPTTGPTGSPTPTLSPTATPTPTSTPMPTVTPTPTPLPTATPTPMPTATPTPQPTQAPNTANLNFQAKFQGIGQQRRNQTVKITLKKEGNIVAVFENIGVNADQNGLYSGRAMNIAPDTYDLYIKGWAHLQKKFEGITLVEGENSQDFSGTVLPAGDADGSNRVDSLDFTILAGHYIPRTPPNSPADFNLDGQVNSLDFTLLAGNYYQGGEE